MVNLFVPFVQKNNRHKYHIKTPFIRGESFFTYSLNY